MLPYVIENLTAILLLFHDRYLHYPGLQIQDPPTRCPIYDSTWIVYDFVLGLNSLQNIQIVAGYTYS